MKRSTFITVDQLKVGAMILVAVAVLGIAAYKLGEAANLFSKRYDLIAYLPTASGLREGGQVTVAGKLVGAISKIEFLPVDNDTTRNLRVVVAIDAGVTQQVRKDSRAHIKTLGLLGDKVFDITPGTPKFPVLRDGDVIAIEPSVDYETVLIQASGAVKEVVGLTTDLRKVTNGITRGEGTLGQLVTNRAMYDNLNSTLANTNRLLVRLQNPRGTVGRLLDDPTLYNSLNKTVESASLLVEQMSKGDGTIGKLFRDDSLYNHLVSAVANADSLTKMMAHGDGTIPKLFNDSQLYDKLVEAVTELNKVLIDVRRDPRRYTKGMIKVF
jgi:phospholipid/cholesterol/gamma-HCH transport system substrate-binding protein